MQRLETGLLSAKQVNAAVTFARPTARRKQTGTTFYIQTTSNTKKIFSDKQWKINYQRKEGEQKHPRTHSSHPTLPSSMLWLLITTQQIAAKIRERNGSLEANTHAGAFNNRF